MRTALFLVILALFAPQAGAIGNDLAAPIQSAALDAAVDDALDGLEWLAMDMHLHTDHSSDGGLFHQQEKDQRNQDTFLDEQRDQALRTQMDAVAFTDHRNFGQHFDPGFDLTGNPLGEGKLLITGEEWGGGRHGTAFGLVEKLEHGSTDRVGCGMAEMTLEAAAQDALLGMAHPKDGGADTCMTELLDFPLSHIEALRGGDNVGQEAGIVPGGGNGSNTAYYQALSAAGGRVPAINGSDNHFKQVWPGPSGPGGSAAYMLVQDRSQAGIVEAVRDRRTIAGWGAGNARVTTLLDADADGVFDAVTGQWAVPTGPHVTVALRIERASGHAVQLWDDEGVLVAEHLPVLPDETVAFELPASSAYYRATIMTSSASQIGLPDPLDYVDTLIVNSTPVWTTPDTGMGSDPTGQITRLATTDWSGFADVAEADGTVHVVWQQREGTTTGIGYARTDDGGATWLGGNPLASAGDVRTPTISAVGDRVTIAYEDHDPNRFGGEIRTFTSFDRGDTFAAEAVSGPNAARPVLSSTADVDHMVWQAQTFDGSWAIFHARRPVAGTWGPTTRLSFAEVRDGGMTNWAVPPRQLLHIPASVNPTVEVQGDVVAVAWEDNREDQTPLRSEAPDDWGIYRAISTDGGQTFGSDERATPRRLRQDDPTDPEGMQGNPALDAELAFGPAGELYLAFTDTFENAGHTDVWIQRSDDSGATWNPPVRIAPAGQWAYRPQLAVDADGAVTALWQQADDPTWSLVRATSTDAGQTFDAPTVVTAGTRYAGWPELVGTTVVFTAETTDGFAVHAGRTGP